ncbi:MAG TPA: tRNA pseudouridine(55) synthase TruB [Candidatus Binatia bacterium]|nr:tRNA pseudouridine(55) synthase TruB [Candidatus Binatia bacterium]
MQSGILLVDKPEGPSSAQIVHKVKALLAAKKVGHLGTLDPFASGLLLLGINEGTKIADVFLNASKTYRGVMTLGVETDSQDFTGNVLQLRTVPRVGKEELEALQKNFTGEIQQTPPMFSALKKGGVRLYRLARQGKTVPRPPRSVRVEHLRLWKTAEAEIEFEVTCSRGTYVRTLAADMGSFLGCGAHLKGLRRLGCGHLTLDRAMPFAEIERLSSRQAIPLVPLNEALEDVRAIAWDNRLLARLRLGQQEVLAQLGTPNAGERLVRILDSRQNLIALTEWREDLAGGRWRLFRVFRE